MGSGTSIQGLLFHLVSILQHAPSIFCADHLVRNGLATVAAFDEDASYRAVDYVPACGTLALSGRLYTTFYDGYENGEVCRSAMKAYNGTSDTTARYDFNGDPVDVMVGDGTALCLCFSLGNTARSSQQNMDMCLGVEGNADAMVSGGEDIGYFVIGQKALPQCDETTATVSTAITSSTASAIEPSSTSKSEANTQSSSALISQRTTLDQSATQLASTAISDGDSLSSASTSSKLPPISSDLARSSAAAPTSPISLSASSANNSPQSTPKTDPPPNGLTQSDNIAIGVGLGMGLPGIIIAAVGLLFLRRHHQTAAVAPENLE